MRLLSLIAVFGFVFVVSQGFAIAGNSISQTPEEKQANTELEMIAKDIAELCKAPGFRGFLRSEIAKSKNRENILELDKFLNRATKQKNMPPKVSSIGKKVKEANLRHNKLNLSDLKGFDLYLPVDAHRVKWKGGENFLVAFSPVLDEKQVTEITAFSVKDGKRVRLDPSKAPEVVVMMIAPCEHETHDLEPLSKPDIKEPLPSFVSREEAERQRKKPTGKENLHPQGNSALQLRYSMIYNDHEPWYAGDPEMYVIYAQGRWGKPLVQMIDLPTLNDTNKWRWTGSTDKLYFYFDTSYTNQSYVAMWERDSGGAFIFGPEASTLDLIAFYLSFKERNCSVDGTPCRYRVNGYNDFVGETRLYKDWFKWGYWGNGIYASRDAYFKVAKYH